MECLEGRQMMFQSSRGIQTTYYNTWRMFETSACKPAALKIMNGLDGPYGTLVLTSLSDGEAYFMLKEIGLTLCPPAQYSKYDLYDLVDKQKKFKINSSEALLNYRLCFTEVATHLQVMNQLSSIEKDDLFLKGFNQEFQSEILQRLKWNGRRQHTEDPWPTCQDSSKLSKVPGGSSRGQALKVDSSKVAVAEPSCSPLVEGQWRTSMSKVGRAKQRRVTRDEAISQARSNRGYGKHTRTPIQNPLNEPQEALDETRTVERPVEPAVHALEVPKPPLEPKDDLHEAPEQAGSRKVEEVKQKIKAKMQSKVVAWMKPPEEKTQRKSLKSVIWRMKDIIPGLWTAHSNARMDLESQCRDVRNKSECA
ncbi:hypothetical protein F5141DRAFT_1060591 [Pisolithus sp. B1]|nr:hypothetical protein F5141DRAFT_1060591 [Pisolithus sp. B1]